MFRKSIWFQHINHTKITLIIFYKLVNSVQQISFGLLLFCPCATTTQKLCSSRGLPNTGWRHVSDASFSLRLPGQDDKDVGRPYKLWVIEQIQVLSQLGQSKLNHAQKTVLGTFRCTPLTGHVGPQGVGSHFQKHWAL